MCNVYIYIYVSEIRIMAKRQRWQKWLSISYFFLLPRQWVACISNLYTFVGTELVSLIENTKCC